MDNVGMGMAANPAIVYPVAALLLAGLVVAVIAWRSQLRRAEVATALVDKQRLELEDLKVRLAGLESQSRQFTRLEQDLKTAVDERNGLNRRVAGLQAELASAQATLNQERRSTSEKLQLLEESRVKLAQEFEHLANRIFEEKSEKFARYNQVTIDRTLVPLREQLQQFRAKVEDVYDRESKQRQSLLAEINQLKQLNHQISQDAVNLARALKGEVKTQGNWGEVILEKVLEESGLRKGHEYEAQVAVAADDGSRRAPDVVVRLPDGKDIVIDAKVSLVDYERYCNADGDEARQLALRSHTTSIKKHVRSLSIKAYDNLPGIRSLDFVLMFIPIEAAFLVAFESDPALFREAYERNIIVVSPTTLLATLRTVQSIWRYERQNRNAEEIADRAGRLYDQIALLAESLEDVGRHLDRARQSQVLTMNRLCEGRGNLVSQAQKLEELGARHRRQLPAHLLETEGGAGGEGLPGDVLAEDDQADVPPSTITALAQKTGDVTDGIAEDW